ncbi:MAG: WD40/YVTN/BNR-like repeat-containing protein [Ktedonobacterales bacterium]
MPTISESRPVASHATRTIFGHRPALAVPLTLLVTLVLAAGCGQTTTRTGKSASHTTATPTTVVTPTPTTPPQSAWHIVPGLANAYTATLVLAPSEPRIAYRLTLGSPCASSCPPPYSLSESDDDGGHWSPRTVPSALAQYQRGARFFIFLNVSPVQPQVLILASSALFGATCPSPSTASLQQTVQSGTLSHFVAQGGVVCWIHFYSADGGQSWRQITMPVPGLLMAPPQARGMTLYATVSEVLGGYDPYIPKPSTRLVESLDGGQTWQTMDAALASAGQTVFVWALLPASSTLYAVTDNAVTDTMGGLWRSDDDGVHWQHLPVVLPAQDVYWIAAGVLAGDNQLVLYLGGGAGATLTPQIFASTDGGDHWSTMPSAGIDITYPAPGGEGGVLTDGSILESFDANTDVVAQPTCAFYAWAPGQSQVQPIGAQLSGQCGSFLLVPAGPVGPGSLWVTYNTFNTPASSETAWLPLANA